MQLLDGPCQGNFLIKRAPLFLRAVKDFNGEIDFLNLVEDMPKLTEKVFVYHREGDVGTVHIDGKGIHDTYVMATYRYRPEVDGEQLRDNDAWRTWVVSQHEQGSAQNYDSFYS